MPGTKETEKELHARFEHLHIRGEWFHADGILLEFIESAKRPAERKHIPISLRQRHPPPIKRMG
jgi:hypothetical protein